MTAPKTVPVAAVVRALRKHTRSKFSAYGERVTLSVADAIDIIRSVAARAGRNGKVKRGQR